MAFASILVLLKQERHQREQRIAGQLVGEDAKLSRLSLLAYNSLPFRFYECLDFIKLGQFGLPFAGCDSSRCAFIRAMCS